MTALSDWLTGVDLPAAELTPGTPSNLGAVYESDVVWGLYKDAILEMRGQYPYGLDTITWDATADGVGPKFVADDADETDRGHGAWVPSAGSAANPILGTGGWLQGEIWQHAKMMHAGVTAQFGPNATAASSTTVSATVANPAIFTWPSAIPLTNGMAVALTNLGGLVLPASSVPDGAYFVRRVGSAGANKFELEVNAGSGTSLTTTGSTTSTLHVDAVASAKGSGGFWRFRNPGPARDDTRFRQGGVGFGHIFMGGAASAFGPGAFRSTILHVTETVSAHVCGIVLGSNLGPSNIDTWTLTNHSDDRSIDENAPGASYDQTIARELRHALGTLVEDVQGLANGLHAGDNVGPLFPWNGLNIQGARIVAEWHYGADL